MNFLLVEVTKTWARRQVFLPMGVAPRKDQLCLAIWATTQSKHALKMASNFNMWGTHHLVNEFWPSLKEAYELQIWKLKFSNVCILICTRVYILIKGLHPSHPPNLKDIDFTLLWVVFRRVDSLWQYAKDFYSTLRLLDLLKFSWNNVILFPHLHSEVDLYKQVGNQTNDNDSELKCNQHQRWYENSKFIGMHPRAKKGWRKRVLYSNTFHFCTHFSYDMKHINSSIKYPNHANMHLPRSCWSSY